MRRRLNILLFRWNGHIEVCALIKIDLSFAIQPAFLHCLLPLGLSFELHLHGFFSLFCYQLLFIRLLFLQPQVLQHLRLYTSLWLLDDMYKHRYRLRLLCFLESVSFRILRHCRISAISYYTWRWQHRLSLGNSLLLSMLLCDFLFLGYYSWQYRLLFSWTRFLILSALARIAIAFIYLELCCSLDLWNVHRILTY